MSADIHRFPHRGLARGRGTLTTDGRYVIPIAVKDGRVWCQHVVDGEVRFDWLPADAVFLGKRAGAGEPQRPSPREEAPFFSAVEAMAGRPCDTEGP